MNKPFDLKELKELNEIVELAIQFRKSVENKVSPEKALAVLKPSEIKNLEDISSELSVAYFKTAFGSAAEKEKYFDLQLKLTNLTAELAGRMMSQEELKGLVPETLKNKKCAAMLHAHEAATLADLCYMPS